VQLKVSHQNNVVSTNKYPRNITIYRQWITGLWLYTQWCDQKSLIFAWRDCNGDKSS
jgi:hypothetical protein